jgi:hypothetical protein
MNDHMRNRTVIATIGLFCEGVVLAGCSNSAQPESRTTERQAVTQTQTGDVTDGVGNLGNGVQQIIPEWSSHTATADEITAVAQLKGPPPAALFTAPIPTNHTSATVDWASAQPSGSTSTYTIFLAEPGFAWSSFQGVKDDARASLVAQRKASLADGQAALTGKLQAISGANIRPLWLINALEVDIYSDALAEIAQWPEVVDIQYSVTVTQLGVGYSGYDRRECIGATQFINAGFTGASGGPSGSQVTVAMVGDLTDPEYGNNVPTDHPGFLYANGDYRFGWDLSCDSISETCTEAAQPTGQVHDTVVAGVLAGSIEAGQDPAYPGTNTRAQIDRSGIAPGVQLLDIGAATGSTADLALAIQNIFEHGADIISISWGVGGTCDVNEDFSGIDAEIEEAFGGGTFVAVAAGDSNTSSSTFSTTCNQTWPSNRSTAFGTNGLATVYESDGTTENPTPALQPGAWSTSEWPVDVYDPGTGGYYASTSQMLGSSAIGVTGLTYYWNSPSSYGYSSSNWVGSSFSAPAVAGGAALLSNAFYSWNGVVRTNWWLKSDLMMLSDGYAFVAYTGSQNDRYEAGVSQYSGTGRLKMHYPEDGSFSGGSWDWSWTKHTLNPGDVFTKKVTADFAQLRAAFFWQETDETHIADIDVYLDGLEANGATVCSTAFAGQSDESISNAIHVTASEVPTCATYVQIRIVAYGIPSGQTRTIYESDLWDHSPGF